MIRSIDQDKCLGRGLCAKSCPLDTIRMRQEIKKAFLAYPDDCMTCYLCERLAGAGIIQYLQCHQGEPDSVSKNGWATTKEELYKPLTIQGIQPKEVLRKIQELVFSYAVCILKTEHVLQDALTKLRQLKQDLLLRMSADDPHYLMKLL